MSESRLWKGSFGIGLSALLAAALVLAACRPAATPTPPPATPTPFAIPTPRVAAAAPTPTPAVATLAPAGTPTPTILAPKRGGILRIAGPQDAPHFDPHRSTSFHVNVFTQLVTSQLVRLDPAKRDVGAHTLVPDLAERWETSADGNTYTFYLRKGVRWHDGKPFTASDVKFSLEKMTDPKRSALSVSFPTFDRAEVVDDTTVKVMLKSPDPSFVLNLASGTPRIYAAHVAAADKYRETSWLVGTGPFKFKERIVGSLYTYERNPDYFLPGLPYLEGVQYYILSDSAYTDAFIAGRLDLSGAHRRGILNAEQLEKINKLVPEAVFYLRATPNTDGVWFNLDRPGPWTDTRVRKAMAMTLDYPGTIIAGRGSPEMGTLGGYFMPGNAFALPYAEVQKLLGIDTPMEVRIAGARKLMAEAGYPDGFKATATTRTGTAYFEKQLLFAADLWKRYLGIDLKVELLETAIAFQRRDAFAYDLLYEGLQAPTGASALEGRPYFYSKANTNWTRYSNPEVDRLFDQIRLESDPKKMVTASQNIERILLTDLPFINFSFLSYGEAAYPYVKGIVPHPLFTSLDYLLWWLDK